MKTKPTPNKEDPKTFLQKYAGLLTAIVVCISTIAGGVLAVDSHYARAEDVKDIAKNQAQAIDVLKQNSKRSLMFEFDYYSRATRDLEEKVSKEKGKVSDSTKRELDETRFKRDLAKQRLVEEK